MISPRSRRILPETLRPQAREASEGGAPTLASAGHGGGAGPATRGAAGSRSPPDIVLVAERPAAGAEIAPTHLPSSPLPARHDLVGEARKVRDHRLLRPRRPGACDGGIATPIAGSPPRWRATGGRAQGVASWSASRGSSCAASAVRSTPSLPPALRFRRSRRLEPAGGFGAGLTGVSGAASARSRP